MTLLSDQSLKHVKERAEKIYKRKKDTLRAKYFIGQDGMPKYIREQVQAIVDGKYTIDELWLARNGHKDVDSYTSWTFAFEFIKDESKNKEDRKGYEAAKEVLRSQYDALLDEIMLGKDASTIRTKLDEFEKAA